ncbi:MAG: hypothetical protein MJA82_09830 [Clostridia bacterium]|nr:hypothetical protein [Clostridia bacterium]
MNIKRLIKYNLDILISKKYIVFFLATFLFPIALNFSNAMYFEMIIPLCGVFIFTNTMFYEKDYRVYQSFYMSSIKKSKIFLIRLLLNIIFYICIAIPFYFYIKVILKNTFVDAFANTSDVSWLIIIALGGINYLLFGLIGVTIANISGKPIMSIGITGAYVVIWMAEYVRFANVIINPFSYSAGCNDYIIYKIVTIILILIMLVFNCYYLDKKFYRLKT